MTTIACPDCGGQVSTTADICPKCRCREPGLTHWWRNVLTSDERSALENAQGYDDAANALNRLQRIYFTPTDVTRKAYSKWLNKGERPDTSCGGCCGGCVVPIVGIPLSIVARLLWCHPASILGLLGHLALPGMAGVLLLGTCSAFAKYFPFGSGSAR